MRYSREFFDLQLQFAKRVAELTGERVESTLRSHTNLYVRFGCPLAGDAAQAMWDEYIDGVRTQPDLLAWTFDFWCVKGRGRDGPKLSHRIGCFGYTPESKEQLRLHFVSHVGVHGSPLARDVLDQRRKELRKLLAEVPSNVRVAGRSWLYNLPRYRSLFPEEYLATAVPDPDAWTRLPLWGQLLHADGNVRTAQAKLFLGRLKRATDVTQLAACFRYQVLCPSAPAALFKGPWQRAKTPAPAQVAGAS